MAATATLRRCRRRPSPTLFDAVDAPDVEPSGISPRLPAAADQPPGKRSASAGADAPDSDTAVVDAPAQAALQDRASRPESPRRSVSAETLAARQRDISVSEFFAKNRHLLGFDNKRKALLTTVKEAVDNSLDACEEAGILPELHVAIDQLAEERFRVTVRDNGPGIVKAQIPNIFGKLLYGSKFHRLKMARGQQGIGISAAGMYGLLTTGKPIHVTSRTSLKKPAHHFQIAIDTAKNRPDTIRDEEQEVAWERGTEVVIELAATYARGRQSVDEYIEQTAIANPHASIHYTGPGGAGAPPAVRGFPRASQELPPETREIQPHPHGIELGVLMKMLKDAGTKAHRQEGTKGEARARTLSSFLQQRFCRVSSRVAHDMCTAAKLAPSTRPAHLAPHDAEKLYQAMQSARIMAPPTDCLAPIGVRALLAGLLKEVKAEFYTATTRDPTVYRGNPFLIEVGLAYGGSISQGSTSAGAAGAAADQPARVIRFANRVPLLYQQSACAAFKSVLDVDWRNYGISQPGGGLPVAPLVIMIHIASVWVPFTSESKEAIADYDEIRKEIKLALQECGRKLAAYIRRRKRQRLEGERRSIFERYIPDVADALAALTGGDAQRLGRELQAIARTRTAEADVELDEDGNPVAKPDEPDELTGDENTLIVEANAAQHIPAELFESPDAAPPRRRRRGAS
jgi:DNA topoisomerase-6 subunit B